MIIRQLTTCLLLTVGGNVGKQETGKYTPPATTLPEVMEQQPQWVLEGGRWLVAGGTPPGSIPGTTGRARHDADDNSELRKRVSELAGLPSQAAMCLL